MVKQYTCPRCEGAKVVIGRCCGGLINECGCMGMPVDMDCSMCGGEGVVSEDPTPELIENLRLYVQEQREMAKDMQQIYTEYQQRAKDQPGPLM